MKALNKDTQDLRTIYCENDVDRIENEILSGGEGSGSLMKRIFFLLLLAASVTVQAETIVHLKKAGKLDAELTPEQIDTCTSLTIIGRLNSDDVRLLRRMAGATDDSEGKGKLRILDLRKVIFQNDDSPYMVLDMGKEHFLGATRAVLYSRPTSESEAFYHVPTNTRSGATKSFHLRKNSIAYYTPSYTISDSRYSDEKGCFIYEAYNRLTVDFTKESSKMERRRLRSYNMLKMKGHKVKWENGRYMWYAYLRKGIFSYDMFYGCDQLQAIALPKGVKVLDYIKVDKDNKRYYSSK